MSYKNINQDLRTTASPTFATVTATGRAIVDDVTDATSTTDGSLQTDGGLSVAKKVYVGETVTAVGRIISDDVTDATSGTDGSIQTDGGISAVKNIYTAEFISTATAKGLKVGGTQVVTDQQAALTAQLTTVTFTAPITPDYAIADLTQTTPFGFVSSDEAQTVLSVIANLQTRVAELESRLQTHGLFA